MPNTLAQIRVSLKEIKGRIDPFLALLSKLDDQFWNETVGAWGRYFGGIDLLSDLSEKEAQDANQRVSGWDGADAAQLIQGIEAAKADCLKISKEYWTTAKRVDAIAMEVKKLKRTCDDAIATKAKKIKKSKSIDELKSLSSELENLIDSLALITSQGPHRPNHKLLQ